ncbi:hypothetical protein ZYGR_0A00720 [Zygosaccharomyces rouxii]|uniref:tRNA (adenine(58)-N(1))-methyltransferase non-catalytic subunit TRM6 n=2 Tax=Zygosaccharomyces rouxii TaxID=4956 RepID=C5DP97_ZYGRC|nr:uncharacterized protein ZYRO0A01540g [Zygosaccharomyces rouxii]KAH9198972.1 Gcd10p family-domain-containing protein [Zygosaccharomyces rouxii]GAV46480.1 hypothetical protein ZYGR_0A00720 [Zygosaccharomyces rouxii]CAR25508.1 ZYRO0A01540p [Zygosaccharomyces rouxii]
MDYLHHITADQHVILKLPSGNWKIVELKPHTSVSLGKFGAFQVDDIIGYPLGTQFEIYYENQSQPNDDDPKNKNRTPVGKVRIMDEDVGGSTEGSELSNVNSSANNMNLINIGNEIQAMTSEQIEELKRQSISGEEIVAKMIESHSAFHKKTLQSQEKYLNRKKRKFAKYFTVEYLSASFLLQWLLEKGDTQKVLDMSEETVAMLLNVANIRSEGQYLCMDETGGLLVYFMLERMFGGDNNSSHTGKIVVLHENEHANLDLLKYSNYSEKFINDHVKTVSLLDFFEPPNESEIDSYFKPIPKEEARQLKAGKKNAYQRRLKWYYNQHEIVQLSTKSQYDALIIASTLQLSTLVPLLAEKVHGSRPVVCYSQFKEILLELTHTLYTDLRFLAPSISETRVRPYQSVRGKLHPLMTMRGGGGYLMWAHRVIPAPEPPAHETEDEGNGPEEKKQKTQ